MKRIEQMITSRLTYPDPFKPTGIEFELGHGGAVTLSILNVSSTQIDILLDRVELAAGHHEVSIAPYRLAPGTYVYTLTLASEEESNTITGKITLVD